MTPQEMKAIGMTDAQIAACVAAIASAADAAPVRPLTMKVSEKGALSVYGLSRQFPTTLYASQWERLLGIADQITAFIAANPEKVNKAGERIGGLARKAKK